MNTLANNMDSTHTRRGWLRNLVNAGSPIFQELTHFLTHC